MPSRVIWREPVQDSWIDYNGHLSEAYYVLVFGHATDAVLEHVGLGPDYRAAYDASVYTVEAHVRYLDQVAAGSQLEVRSDVIGASDKLMRVWHELWVADRLRATEEILGVHVRHERSAPFPAEVAERLAACRIQPPERAGARIRLRERPARPTSPTPDGPDRAQGEGL